MRIEAKTFNQLSIEELYAALKLRTDVFVVEQECAYPELDGFDQKAMHIMGFEGNELQAYARVLPAGTVYNQPSIGRVAVEENHRKKGYGRQIFKEALDQITRLNPGANVKIQAQCYLESFYASFGFQTISEPYPDAGVWHVDMLLEP